ncbi:PRD domain-containing protein, partial [Erysipelatoclostridium ramosum]|nr:PRD domain-containing protein [Thomasclavelia ramosa]
EDATDVQHQIFNIHPDTPAFLILDVQCSDMRMIKQVQQKLQKQHAALHSSWKICYLFHDMEKQDSAALQGLIDYPMVFPCYEQRTLK